MSADTLYKINHDAVVWRFVESRAVILNVTTNCYYSLNEVGTFIWNLLVDELSVEQITKEIQEGFSISAEQAEDDLKGLIANLEAEALIRKEQ